MEYIQKSQKYLEEKADQLDKERPSGYWEKTTNPRTLVPRFGDITFSRGLYQDRHGEYHFLLDEYLNWRPHQAATPSLTEALLESATGNTFRKVSREVDKYTAGVLSASTVQGLLQRVTQDVIDKERDDWGTPRTGLQCPSVEWISSCSFLQDWMGGW